jgi:hypothetical protein
MATSVHVATYLVNISVFSSRHGFKCSEYGTKECINYVPESPGQRRPYTSESRTRFLSPPPPHSQTLHDQSSTSISSNVLSVGSCANYPGLKNNQTHPHELTRLECGTSSRVSPKHDFETRNVLHRMQTSGWEVRFHKSNVQSDTDPYYPALLVVSAQANVFADVISTTASSAVRPS